MNISSKFQLQPSMASEDVLFVLANLAFRLPWQLIKFRGLDKIHIVGTELLKKHFCKTFVKIPSVRQQQMPIFSFTIISQ